VLEIRPQVTHFGIYARDLAKMEAFYTGVLGLLVTDHGKGQSTPSEFVFLSGSPDTHHQLVLVSGRPPEGVSTVNQISLKLRSLDEMKEMARRVKASGVEKIVPIDHGVSFSFYCADPEGSGIEIYMDTPWYVPQPVSVPLDLSLPNDVIMAASEARWRATPGFLPASEWRAGIAARLALRAENG
jgi:catechol 2,3-dioxygenase